LLKIFPSLKVRTMINLIAFGLPVIMVATIGFYLFLRHAIIMKQEVKEMKDAIKEAIDVKKESEERRSDPISVVDERLSEFTRKE
jgi:hypothetical protein